MTKRRILPTRYYIYKVSLAMTIALDAHGDQEDKVGDPYIWHPCRIAAHFQEKLDWEATIVSWLHDVIEDTDFTSIELLKSGFWDDIADAVDAISRREQETYKDYIRRCCKNDIARRVKKQDVLDNMRPERNCENNPISRYKWTLNYIKDNYNE